MLTAVVSAFLWSAPVVADQVFKSPRGTQRVITAYSEATHLKLLDDSGTEVRLENIDFKWCLQKSCFKFKPSTWTADKKADATWIRARGREGANLEIKLTESMLAYRFRLQAKAPVRIESERLRLYVPGLSWSKGTSKACGATPVDCFHSSHEGVYESPVNTGPDRLIFLPLLLKGAGRKIYVSEMNVGKYAGAYLAPDAEGGLNLSLPRFPRRVKIDGDFSMEQVLEREEFVSEHEAGEIILPWRFVKTLKSDADLFSSQEIRSLADPLLPNSPWIKRGFGTEEWITGAKIDLPAKELGFTPGINTATYKYYIDFARRFGLKYVILDDGWSNRHDLRKINPDVDIAELKAHADKNGVSLILWVMSATLREKTAEKIAYLKSLGAAALKIDFFDRDDAAINRFQYEIFKETYRHKLMVIMHGVAKPTGQDIAFPHIMGWEAGMGHEYNKWSKDLTPKQELGHLFLRNPIGSFDFEGAGFRHLQPAEFEMNEPNPIAQGTRTSEISYYALVEAKMQVIAGNLGDYVRSPEHTQILTRIPVEWDEVVPLSAEVDHHALVAKRSGKVWYVAGLSAADTRLSLPVELGRFLKGGRYEAERLEDCFDQGASASCSQLKRESLTVGRQTKIVAQLAPHGGYLLRLEPSGQGNISRVEPKSSERAQ